MCRAALLVLLVSRAAFAAPKYPVVLPTATPAVRAAHAQAFRTRNPQHFTAVDVDEHGFVTHVVSDDPQLAPPTGAKWPEPTRQRVLALLAANADLFGFDPAVLEELDSSTAHFLLVDTIGGATRGEIQVMPTGAGIVTIDVTPWIVVTPKLTEADVANKLVGARYKETIGYGRMPQRDCAMGPGGGANCRSPATQWKTRTIKLDTGSIRSTAWFRHEGNAIRLVACADAQISDDPEIERANDLAPEIGVVSRSFAPINAPPMPLIVDLVTGQQIPSSAKTCDDPSITNQR